MATESKVPEAGKRAPAFNLPAYPEGKVRLSQFKGEKNVLLYFYPKTTHRAVQPNPVIFGIASPNSNATIPLF